MPTQPRDAAGAGDQTKEKMIFAAIRQSQQDLMEMEREGRKKQNKTKHSRMLL